MFLPKVKIHCWRSLLAAIPCYGVLVNRHIRTKGGAHYAAWIVRVSDMLFSNVRVFVKFGNTWVSVEQSILQVLKGPWFLQNFCGITHHRCHFSQMFFGLVLLTTLSGMFGGSASRQLVARTFKSPPGLLNQYLQWLQTSCRLIFVGEE